MIDSLVYHSPAFILAVYPEEILEMNGCLLDLITAVSNTAVRDLKDQLIAQITATCALMRCWDTGSADTGRVPGMFFSDLWNEVSSVKGSNELAQYLAETVLEWWNYQSGDSSCGKSMYKEL